jgi:hypothetical protein
METSGLKRTLSSATEKVTKKSKKAGKKFFTEHAWCQYDAENVVVLGTRLNCIFDPNKGLLGVLMKMKGDKVDMDTLNKLAPEGETKEETTKLRMNAIKNIKDAWLGKASEFTDVEKIKEALDVEKAGWEPGIEGLIALSFFSADYENVMGMIELCASLSRSEQFTEAGVDGISEKYESVEENFYNITMETYQDALESMLAGKEIDIDDFDDLSEEGFLVDLEEAHTLSDEIPE